MENVYVSYEEGIALITIDNPPLNALSNEIVAALGEAFDSVAQTSVSAVVVTGAGGKSFVAGADISQFPKLGGQDGIEFVRQGQRVYQRISQFDRPVICAVNGYALGGGCELALACDIRVADEKAKFGLPEVTLGILPGYGGTQRLPRLVGKGMAKKLIFSGEPISAQEAQRIGLVEAVAPAGQALDQAMELAKRIRDRCAPLAVREIKRVVDQGCAVSLEEGIELEAQAFGRLCATQDKNEGVVAFFEKRKARFQGM